VSDLTEVVETFIPVLVVVSSEWGELDSVTIWKLVAVLEKPLTAWKT
jgi:hypothetical protein